MAPSQKELIDMAVAAEQDVNSYQNKTGAGKDHTTDEAGVDSRAAQKFPGAEVRYEQDMGVNAMNSNRIPPEEGGEVDSRGRATKPEHFEGMGGPEHKLAQQAQKYGGYDELDSTNTRQAKVESTSAQDTSLPVGANPKTDPMTYGKMATEGNVEKGKHMTHQKEQFKGADYYQPESVPDSISAEGYIPPESVTQTSREAEQP